MKSILQITKSTGQQLLRIAHEHKCPYILFMPNAAVAMDISNLHWYKRSV